MIIAVDFDGTLTDGVYPELGKPQPGAVKAMSALKDEGHYLILWTCRTGDKLRDAINWMLEHGIPFDRVNDHCPANIAQYGDGGPKVYADVYLDDRNLGGFPGWFVAQDMLRAMSLVEEAGRSARVVASLATHQSPG